MGLWHFYIQHDDLVVCGLSLGMLIYAPTCACVCIQNKYKHKQDLVLQVLANGVLNIDQPIIYMYVFMYINMYQCDVVITEILKLCSVKELWVQDAAEQYSGCTATYSSNYNNGDHSKRTAYIYAVTTPPLHLTMQPLCYRCLTSQCLTVVVYVTLRVSLGWNTRLGPWRYSWLCYSASCCGPLVYAPWLLFHAVSMAQKMLTTAAPTATTILEQRSVCNSNQATVIVCAAITVATLWF